MVPSARHATCDYGDQRRSHFQDDKLRISRESTPSPQETERSRPRALSDASLQRLNAWEAMVAHTQRHGRRMDHRARPTPKAEAGWLPRSTVDEYGWASASPSAPTLRVRFLAADEATSSSSERVEIDLCGVCTAVVSRSPDAGGHRELFAVTRHDEDGGGEEVVLRRIGCAREDGHMDELSTTGGQRARELLDLAATRVGASYSTSSLVQSLPGHHPLVAAARVHLKQLCC